MAMRRKAKVKSSATKEYVMGQARLVAGHATHSLGLEEIDLRIIALDSSMKAGFNRVARELDNRPTRSEMQEGFSAVHTKLDRIIGVLDTVVGKQHDNDQSHIMFGSMHGDHRRALASHEQRISALESRLPPRTP